MNLYLIEMMSGNRRYVVARTMEEATRAVEKPRFCEMVAATQYWDNMAQLTILG